MRSDLRLLSLLATFALLPSGGGASSAPAAAAVKLFVREPGLYRVTYEELAAVGWPAGLSADRLVLTQRGGAVPLGVEDGGDGTFDPGDTLAFLGDRLAGEHGHFNEFTAFNVYRLTTGEAAGSRRFVPIDAHPASPVGMPSSWQRRIRLEQDRLLLRYPNQGIADDELWYWAKLSHIDPAPLEVEVDLRDLAPNAAVDLRIAVELRGWSRPARKPSPEFPDHRVELLWNGRPLAEGEWSGFDKPFRLLAAALPPEVAKPGIHRLGLRVPPRPATATGDPLVDVVVLNWIEIVAPRRERLEPGVPQRIEPAGWGDVGSAPGASADGAGTGGPARVVVAAGADLEVFAESGGRVLLAAPAEGERFFELAGPAARSPLWVASAGVARRVDGLEADAPSRLRSPERQADYLMVAHPRLLEAVRPLAELHQRRGLTVELVDVRDVYDEWNDGIVHPRAIRDFVSYAYHSWRRPAPRFLLLVGDASWDGKNDRAIDESPDWAFLLTDRAGFIKNGSTPYGGTDSRNLIPAWDYGTHEGHAAGDNGYVSVDGEDELPDLAVGRFPVTEPAEVEAIVAKTIAYLEAPPLGDWRNRVLWVTNEERYWQQSSDALAALLAGRGIGARKVYPPSEVPADAQDQAVLRAAFDEGALLVHFVGHGGRYIWRTGPPDLATQRDLFDLKDVELLAANGRLPLVLSLTCYSAPFDHPTADSIGEKLLRQGGRGAVAVFAASWRNAPVETWSRRLADELLLPGTVGEALVRVKRAVQGRDFVRQYNLLGDPALVLALAREAIEVRASRGEDGAPRAEVTLPTGFRGNLTVEWIDGRGEVVAREERPVDGTDLLLRPTERRPELAGAVAVRLYAWDEVSGRDARGAATLAPAPAAESTGVGRTEDPTSAP